MIALDLKTIAHPRRRAGRPPAASVPPEKFARGASSHHTVKLSHAAVLSMRFMIPEMTLPGPT